MNSLIISAIGADRPGIVSELSNVITSHGANVEESRMIRLGSGFAIVMLVSVTPDWIESLKVALQSINEITIITESTKSHGKNECIQCQIDLTGADNEGIVKVLSKYLAGKYINILEMETNISHAPISGTPLFNLNASIVLPKDARKTEIKEDLFQIALDLGVEINLVS